MAGWRRTERKYLVPVTIATQAERNKTYWCRGLFTGYEMFGVRSRLVLPSAAEQAQKSALGEQ